MANDRNWSRTAAIEVCLPFNFAASLILCTSVSSPAHKINRQCPTNRQNAALRSMFFFLLYNAHCYWRTELFCVTLHCSFRLVALKKTRNKPTSFMSLKTTQTKKVKLYDIRLMTSINIQDWRHIDMHALRQVCIQLYAELFPEIVSTQRRTLNS